MFSGFTDKTFEFFMAIRFNNNVTFFHENHGWYEESVRRPMKALAASLGGAIEALDPTLERRPEKVISRINRDIRFSRDKSPYRDYLWMSFRQQSEARDSCLGVYFDISDNGMSCGMGIYNENRPLMNGLRRQLTIDSAPFLEAAAPALAEFTLKGDAFKRMKVPEDLPGEAKAWYPLKSFYIEKNLPMSLAYSTALAEEIERGIALFTPLYRFLSNIEPVSNDNT